MKDPRSPPPHAPLPEENGPCLVDLARQWVENDELRRSPPPTIPAELLPPGVDGHPVGGAGADKVVFFSVGIHRHERRARNEAPGVHAEPLRVQCFGESATAVVRHCGVVVELHLVVKAGLAADVLRPFAERYLSWLVRVSAAIRAPGAPVRPAPA